MLTKKTFNQNWFCRLQWNKNNILISYNTIRVLLMDKADKVLSYVENPPRHAVRPNGNVVVKPFHGVTLTFIAK